MMSSEVMDGLQFYSLYKRLADTHASQRRNPGNLEETWGP